jgi:putative redox protein
MHTSELEYVGKLRTNALHINSSQEIYTDAPLDNHGKGEAFSPTDLLATSLAACMMTVMGIAAESHNIRYEKVHAQVTKVMESNPRRVSEIRILLKLAGNFSQREKSILENTAKNCPVAKSLNPKLIQTVRFEYVSL